MFRFRFNTEPEPEPELDLRTLDQIRMDTEDHLQDVQMLQDVFITRDNIYAIVYNKMKKLIYFDKNELTSLEKWKQKLINTSGNCLF
ncbi:hypothetical protein C2G38_2233474 [Gigaspora rosea]|uniref:Uncharacterized protein n=1 Tax=Gigaspora rosea TaxID=44941 RepID=A0A397TTB5_9GLOM|nr:hypothetical protein C2G38_2233474 [Gigaspora rosea]